MGNNKILDYLQNAIKLTNIQNFFRNPSDILVRNIEEFPKLLYSWAKVFDGY